jgi:hypothetical protein
MDTTPNPIPSYLAGILRTALAFLAGLLVTKGWITAEQSAELVGAGLVVITAAWGIYQKYAAHKDLKSAIAAPAGQA